MKMITMRPTYRIQPKHIEFELTVSWLAKYIEAIWEPLLLGSLICGTVAAFLGYVFIRIFWRFWVIAHWRKRKLQRKATK